MVVTIIVLLILATVAINLSVGNNGIFTRAQDAVEINRAGTVRDKVEMWKGDVQIALADKSSTYMEEAEMLQSLKDEGLVKDEEINEDRKVITINGIVIDYNLEIDKSDDELEPDEGKEEMILAISADNGSKIEFYINNYYERYNYNFTIDWGDGKKETPEQGLDSISHTYESKGEYNIIISGICEYFQFNSFLSDSSITEIKQWGTLGLKEVSFSGCNSLKKVASPTKNSLVNVESFGDLFLACNQLTVIPTNLFKGCTKASSFFRILSNTSIESIPEKLFEDCINARSFGGAFSGTLIKSIPENLFKNCVNADEFNSTFSDCINLKDIPDKLFDNCDNVDTFKGLFSNCTGLEGMAPKLWERVENGEENDYIGEPNGDGCFYGCEKLQNYAEIPDYWKQRPTIE